MNNKTSLGRGLSSLIPKKSLSSENEDKKDQINLSVELIKANPFQPRNEFNQEDLENLAKSIKDKGILQPLVVSFDEENKTYQLIAGERRLRASKLIGLKEVPVIIRKGVSNQDKAELALIENIQRQDLNPIERAKGFLDLKEKFGFTQQQIAENLNLSRSGVANTLRYLDLPERIKQALINEEITEGHAKVLAGIQDPKEQNRVLDEILKYTLNVRQTEKIIKKEPTSKLDIISPDIKTLITSFSEKLQNKVEIRKKGKRYIMTLNFFSEEEVKNFTNKIKE